MRTPPPTPRPLPPPQLEEEEGVKGKVEGSVKKNRPNPGARSSAVPPKFPRKKCSEALAAANGAEASFLLGLAAVPLERAGWFSGRLHRGASTDFPRSLGFDFPVLFPSIALGIFPASIHNRGGGRYRARTYDLTDVNRVL